FSFPRGSSPKVAGSPGHLAAGSLHPYPPGMVSIATWNINSVRLRIAQVERFLSEHCPDVLCLQEIKCREEQFPHAAFEALGYRRRVVHGQKGYHGVATVSRKIGRAHV